MPKTLSIQVFFFLVFKFCLSSKMAHHVPMSPAQPLMSLRCALSYHREPCSGSPCTQWSRNVTRKPVTALRGHALLPRSLRACLPHDRHRGCNRQCVCHRGQSVSACLTLWVGSGASSPVDTQQTSVSVTLVADLCWDLLSLGRLVPKFCSLCVVWCCSGV